MESAKKKDQILKNKNLNLGLGTITSEAKNKDQTGSNI